MCDLATCTTIHCRVFTCLKPKTLMKTEEKIIAKTVTFGGNKTKGFLTLQFTDSKDLCPLPTPADARNVICTAQGFSGTDPSETRQLGSCFTHLVVKRSPSVWDINLYTTVPRVTVPTVLLSNRKRHKTIDGMSTKRARGTGSETIHRCKVGHKSKWCTFVVV